MLQIFVLLILYSINDLTLVKAYQFDSYKDFVGAREFFIRHNFYFTKIIAGDFSYERACVCEKDPPNGDKYQIVCYSEEEPENGGDYQYINTVQVTGIKDELQCINCLLQESTYKRTGSSCNTELQFPIRKYLSAMVYKYETSDRTFITADKTLVQNFSNSTQTGQATSYSKSVSETSTYTFGISVSIRAEAEVKVPFIAKANVGIEVTGSFSYSYSTTVTTTVTAPAQTVNLDAGKQIIITYGLYQATFRSSTLLSFVIEEDGNTRETEPQRFKFFKRQIQEYKFETYLFPFPNKPAMILTSRGEWELRNMPAEEVVAGHELHILYGKDETVQGSPELGPNDRVITVG